MSSVIVLSDSDEPASPIIDKCKENEIEINEGHRYNDTSDFDFPEVPFCREILENPMSQSEDEDLPNLNVDNGYKHPPGSSHTMSDSHDSDDNLVEKTSRKATASKKDKITLRMERLKRQQAQAREKALKAIEKKRSKDIKPGECLKFMEVNVDRNIDVLAFRTEIESVLRSADIKINVTTELIPNSITWQRTIEDNYVGEDNEVHVNKSIQVEEYIIVIWSNYEAVKHVAEGTFSTSVLHNKSLIPNYNMTLVIFGMEEYFAKKQKTDQSSKSKGSRFNNKGNQHFETFPIISRQQLEMCMTEVQIVAKCTSRLIENTQDLGLMVYQYTKSISEIPYKLQKRESQENKFDWYVMGDNKNTVRVDKDGNGLKRLWQQQLCQFNLSSLETSEAICTVYPSPVQLIKAYRNCTPDEGMNLLKDIPIRRAAGPLTAVRKIGPELSKKIYMMFTSQNGDALLGTEIRELEKAEPFTRKIHENELWLYRNPRTDSFVPTTILWPLVFMMPIIVICFFFIMHKDKVDLQQSVLSVTLALGFNGLITDILKLIVGRPRPDFFWRCFPDGQINPTFKCTGDPIVIRDGKKSFPSGHSSFAFASFGFISLYLAGKLHTFSLAGKGQSWRLCTFFLPLCIALTIALSRTCDYHHHWQDVAAGSVIGYCLTYICYRHYYPPLDSPYCNKPYTALTLQIQSDIKSNKNEQIKWI